MMPSRKLPSPRLAQIQHSAVPKNVVNENTAFNLERDDCVNRSPHHQFLLSSSTIRWRSSPEENDAEAARKQSNENLFQSFSLATIVIQIGSANHSKL